MTKSSDSKPVRQIILLFLIERERDMKFITTVFVHSQILPQFQNITEPRITTQSTEQHHR